MTYEQDLHKTRMFNRELDLFIRLLEAHPKTLHIGVISETRADFERTFLSHLDPDIAERLQNEIVGYLKMQLSRSTWREYETAQLIREKSMPQYKEPEKIVPVFALNHSFHTSNV